MAKIIDLQKYKENNPKNKVIEVDFKTRQKKTTKVFSGEKLVKEIEAVKKNQTDSDPDGVA